MLNKKGQVLVTFVILIPVVLLMLGSLIELSVLEYNKKKVYSVTKSIIASEIESPNEAEIKNLFEDNDIKGTITVDTSDGLKINVKTSVNSTLGKIINKDKYDIDVTIKGHLEDNKVIYEKGV